MYTEIKEAVAFLFRFYRNNMPRRRMSLMMAKFGSLLAQKYQETWDINDPKRGEEIRMIDFCLKDMRGAVLDKLFTAAAEAMICTDILMKTPDIKLYINPGAVFYTFQGETNPTLIWTGDVNSDNNYNPVALGSMSSRPVQRNMVSALVQNIYLSGDAKNVPFNYENEDTTPLVLYLVDLHPDFSSSPIGKPFKKFVYHSPDYRPISVAAFAKTRFGSSKTRPDHDNYRRLQVAAGQASFPHHYHHVVGSPVGAGDDNSESLMRSFFPSLNSNLLFPPLNFQH